MRYDVTDTIAAIASPTGTGGRGIVRMAGPRVVSIARDVFTPEAGAIPASGAPRMLRGLVRVVQWERTVPALALVWPTSRSYTRQPQVEFHTLASRPVLDALLQTVCGCGARIAEPGEFTLRAFLAGRMDLAQAEAVLALIEARRPDEVELALRQMAAGLGSSLTTSREALADLLAEVEAGLDFTEEDIRFLDSAELLDRIERIAVDLETMARTMRDSALRCDAPRVVFTGPANVGKSSLFNFLLGSPRAIVSDVAGTTRDYLAAFMEWRGTRFLLVDTAGTHEARQSDLERRALAHARDQHDLADLLLTCRQASSTEVPGVDRGAWREDRDNVRTLSVWTKCDLLPPETVLPAGVATSTVSGLGREELLNAIVQHLERLPQTSALVVAATAARCEASVGAALHALQRAGDCVRTGIGHEYAAAELRAALERIGEMTGAVYTEEILDRVFGKFCIGK